MRDLIVHLPEGQRTAVTLRHLEQMEYAQIAIIMEISESTVRAHVRAGREALRRMIVSKHPEWQP
jgi:RNA polymerase sigma factor (sigma-70 family)